jgi:hypothetical protein
MILPLGICLGAFGHVLEKQLDCWMFPHIYA